MKLREGELARLTEQQYSQDIRLNGAEREGFNSRDRTMDSKIRELRGRVLHVGGLTHIFGDYENLYHLLRDMNPRRIRLNEADSL